MSIKSKRITIRIFATFLILSLTLCYFTIGVSAGNYTDANDTVYKSADAFGWEELPYGTDTGVVQFQYSGGNYLTLYFDKLSIYADAVGDYDNESRYVNDYYWNVVYDDSSGKLDYLLNIASDNPIYYKTAYSSGSVFSSTIGERTQLEVTNMDIVDGTTQSYKQTYYGYCLEDYPLSNLVPSWSISSASGSRRVYANCYQIHVDSIFYYYPYPGAGATSWVNGKNVGYNIEYYPTCEYLQNYQLRDDIVSAWDELVTLNETSTDILNSLYTANLYLSEMSMYLMNIDIMTANIYSILDIYLPLLNYNLGEILTVLEEMKTGPAYDSSQGIGSNTEFGDSAESLIGNPTVPDSGINTVKNGLKSSFLLIRCVFDSLVYDWFPLGYVITFLLGLSFIAYVLGRVIKNKMR